MAILILETPHLSQVYIEDNEDRKVFVYNEEPFFAHVEGGNLFAGNNVEEHLFIDISSVNILSDIDLAGTNNSKCIVSQLPDVDLIEFNIDETNIEAEQIKFRRLLPFGVLELSGIEYNGVFYKGIRNSSLNRQKQPKQD